MTASNRFISYLRVSTAQQGRSGLGLHAQRAAVAAYVADRGELLREFLEVETGKGADALDRRSELRAALAMCKKERAVLLIAKLDRLARNVHFVTGLIETGVDFIAVDMPNANKVMIQMHAVMSEYERDQISARTRAALAAAKARGIVLGRAGPANLQRNLAARQEAAAEFAERLRPLLSMMTGLSQREKAMRLNEMGLMAPGGGAWQQGQLSRIEARLRDRPTLAALV
jgi:DNA invertase Pin-like site-specific DNA recombinase